MLRIPLRTIRRAIPGVARPYQQPARTLMTLKNHKYTAHATARGRGRDGEVESGDEASLKLHLGMPQSLGGKGDGQNPEQILAMGYSACFLGAMQMVASKMGKSDMAKNAIVHTEVHLGQPNDMEGFGLEVDIKVEGADEELIKAGNEACPYSRAFKNGVVVNVSKA